MKGTRFCHVKDQKTLAYINLFGILGALGKLAELDAARPRAGGPESSRFRLVLPSAAARYATLHFADGGCTQTEGVDRCDIKLAFSAPEKFNGMIDGTVTPIPRKGFTRIGFLTGNLYQADPISSPATCARRQMDLVDEHFFEVSTTLMLYVIAGAVAQIGNYDEALAASRLPISSTATSCSRSKTDRRRPSRQANHVLSFRREGTANPRAVMEFASIRLARDLFDGNVNSMAWHSCARKSPSAV